MFEIKVSQSKNANEYYRMSTLKVNILGENVIFEAPSKFKNLFIYIEDAKYEMNIFHGLTPLKSSISVDPEQSSAFDYEKNYASHLKHLLVFL